MYLSFFTGQFQQCDDGHRQTGSPEYYVHVGQHKRIHEKRQKSKLVRNVDVVLFGHRSEKGSKETITEKR